MVADVVRLKDGILCRTLGCDSRPVNKGAVQERGPDVGGRVAEVKGQVPLREVSFFIRRFAPHNNTVARWGPSMSAKLCFL
jgi:hypothetical protein